MTVENISWSISTKECCRPRRGLNPRPPGLQSDGASKWATEAGVDPDETAWKEPSGSTPFAILILTETPWQIQGRKSPFQNLRDEGVKNLYLIMDNPTEAARCLNSDSELMYQWTESWFGKI